MKLLNNSLPGLLALALLASSLSSCIFFRDRSLDYQYAKESPYAKDKKVVRAYPPLYPSLQPVAENDIFNLSDLAEALPSSFIFDAKNPRFRLGKIVVISGENEKAQPALLFGKFAKSSKLAEKGFEELLKAQSIQAFEAKNLSSEDDEDEDANKDSHWILKKHNQEVASLRVDYAKHTMLVFKDLEASRLVQKWLRP